MQKCVMINIALIAEVKDWDIAMCIQVYLLHRNESQMAIFALVTVIPARQPSRHLLWFFIIVGWRFWDWGEKNPTVT